MKRKLLLLVAAVAMLVCLLAISVSAEVTVVNTITSETYGTVYQLSGDPGLDNADQYVSTLKTIEDKGKDTDSLAILFDGTYYYVFPSSYLVDEMSNGKFSFTLTMGAGSNFSSTQKGINNVFAEWAEAEGVTLPTFETANAWGNTRVNCLVRFEIPTDVGYFDRNHCLIKGDELVEVRFTKSVGISSGGIFASSAKLTTVVGLDMCSGENFPGGMFNGCSSLVSVKLPSDVTSIPKECFYNCVAFEAIENWDEIKNNITSVGESAFYNCDALVSISLPSLTSIGKHAFKDCSNLETVDLAGSSFVKLNSAFRGCSKLDGIVLPDTVDGISQDGFNGCSSLTSIVIPRDATYIGGYAFSGCSSLKVIDMSKAVNLKSTGNNSFNGVIVEELHFPKGFETFGGISAYTLKVLTFPDSTTSLSVIKAGITEFRVPLGVTSLGNKTFDYCSSLQSVTLHKGVTSLVTGSNPSFFGSTLTNLTTIYYTGTSEDAFVELLQTAAPKATIDYVDHCETYLGGHAWSGAEKVIKTSYFDEIGIGDTCTACNLAKVKSTIEALFVNKGVSAKTFGEDIALVQGYEINRTAIGTYKNYVADFDFGILAYANNGGTACRPKPGEGKVVDIVFDNMANDYIEVKLTGVPQDCEDVKLVFCAYVTEGESIYYLDDGETLSSVIGKSYNDIVD